MTLPSLSDPWRARALLSCEEMRKAEALSVARGGDGFFDLMLRAGAGVAQAVQDFYPQGRVLVLCGTGNNGGDGYVCAQSLREAGREVRVAVLGPPATEDARAAAARWRGASLPLETSLFNGADVVVDALFGTGLSRPLDGAIAQTVQALLASGKPVVAADMPSGVCGDTGRVLGCAVKAAVTVTFFRKKRGQLLLPAREHIGRLVVFDTLMPEDVLETVHPLVAENDLDLWREHIPHLQSSGHKYDRGHALVFGGAVMTGASRLAARAAQRAGAGLVSLLAPDAPSWEVYAKALESVIVLPPAEGAASLADPRRNALLIGPGLGLDPALKETVLAVLATGKRSVLDADALTLFADEPEVLFKALHENCILTPHEGEFSRLFANRIDPADDKLARALHAARLAGCTVLLKGADTVIAAPEGAACINSNAPPWLAVAGAGDVLAGVALGLLAGGMTPFAAASAAAFIHGSCAQAFGPGLIAEDLIDGLPAFWSRFYGLGAA